MFGAVAGRFHALSDRFAFRMNGTGVVKEEVCKSTPLLSYLAQSGAEG